jgi:hypothetical protein
MTLVKLNMVENHNTRAILLAGVTLLAVSALFITACDSKSETRWQRHRLPFP